MSLWMSIENTTQGVRSSGGIQTMSQSHKSVNSQACSIYLMMTLQVILPHPLGRLEIPHIKYLGIHVYWKSVIHYHSKRICLKFTSLSLTSQIVMKKSNYCRPPTQTSRSEVYARNTAIAPVRNPNPIEPQPRSPITEQPMSLQSVNKHQANSYSDSLVEGPN